MENMPELPEVPLTSSRERRKRRLIIVSLFLSVMVLGLGAVGWCVCVNNAYQEEQKTRKKRIEEIARQRLKKRAAEKAQLAMEPPVEETPRHDSAEEPPVQQEPVPAPQPQEKQEEPQAQSPAAPLPSPPQNAEQSASSSGSAEDSAPVVEPADSQPPPVESESEPSSGHQPSERVSDILVQPINVSDSDAVESAVRLALEEGRFDALAESLIPGIRAASQNLLRGSKLNYAAYCRIDSLMTAVELCILIKSVGEEKLRLLVMGKEAGQGKVFMNWLVRDRCRPLRAFIRNYMVQEGSSENMAHSLRTLFDIWKETPETDRSRYLNPAIACALLCPEVAQSPGQIRLNAARLTPAQVFQYFREQDRHRRLLTDIKKMSVERLLMVVDVRLPLSEFKWVTKNLKYDRAAWAHKAYNAVPYLMERATRDTDPYTTYTFEEILEKGGVCRDQAYFAAYSAKVMGIPSVIAVGDGDRGPHAWVVTQVSETEWQQVNSYGYTTGVFDNACSGREHHESMLLTRTKRDNPEKFNTLADGLVFSRFMSSIGAHAEARGAARFVVSAFPENTAAWDNLVEVMEAEDAPELTTEEWQQIHRRILRNTRKNSELNDLAAYVEDEYLMSEGNVAARKASMDRNIRNMRRNVGMERSDLVVEAINRQAAILTEKGDVRGLLRLYRKELKSFTSRGDVFLELLEQCEAHFSAAEASARDWGSLAKEVEKLFERHIRSSGADYFKLSKEVEIQKKLVELYENSGNGKKANRIYQDAVLRLEQAEEKEEN